MMSRLYFSLAYYFSKLLELVPVILLGAVICAVVLRRRGKKLTSSRSVVTILFVAYLTGLLALTVAPNDLWTHLWYVLRYHRNSGITFRFFTFNYDLTPQLREFFSYEGLGNLLLFIPFGFLVPLLWKRVEGWRTPALALGLSLCIETSQLFLDRSFDVNDLILNTAGGAVGCLLFVLFRAIFPGFVAKCRKS